MLILIKYLNKFMLFDFQEYKFENVIIKNINLYKKSVFL